MSQKRNKGKSREVVQNGTKLSQSTQACQCHNELFDDLRPPQMYILPNYMSILASASICFFNLSVLIVEYILMFGNKLWRYETRLFLVSLVLSLKNPILITLNILLKNVGDETRRTVFMAVKVLLFVICLLLPRYTISDILDMSLSFSMDSISLFLILDTTEIYDAKQSFYRNVMIPALQQWIISVLYPLLYIALVNLTLYDVLFPVMMASLLIEIILSYQRLLFRSHIYSEKYKYQGCWIECTSAMEQKLQGHIEEWKQNHVYSYGAVVNYKDKKVVACGYLNTVEPFQYRDSIPFYSIYEKKECHLKAILTYLVITTLLCFQLIYESFQLKYIVTVIICIISLILMFPMHTLAEFEVAMESSDYSYSRLPLSLLRAARDRDILVELVNGETYNGKLLSCDSFMNVVLIDVTLTTKDGSRFFHMAECYIRGSTVKCLRLSKEAIDNVPQEELNSRYNKARVTTRKPTLYNKRGGGAGGSAPARGRGRGGRGGRGNGRGRGQ